MGVNDQYILAGSILLTSLGISLMIWLGYKNGYLTFLGTMHIYAFILAVIGGICAWLAMVLTLHPNKLKIDNKQWFSLGVSIFMSILWYIRFSYTTSSTVEESKNN